MYEKTLNAAAMKAQNRQRVVRSLRVTPSSRADLARATGLTRASISLITEDLLKQGVITEQPFKTVGKGAGRRGLSLGINPEACWSLGLNIARTEITWGVMDFSGRILEEHSLPLDSQSTAETLLQPLKDDFKRCLTRRLPGQMVGLGITAPGPLDNREGIILQPPNFDVFRNFPIKAYFSQSLGVPVYLENNAGAMALAEKVYGAAQDISDYILLVVDSGVGVGLVLDGVLQMGSRGLGNEFGHSSINFQGERCSCGNFGCAELYASIPNLMNQLRQKWPEYSQWSQVLSGLDKACSKARAGLAMEAEYLACLLVNIINITDVETIIIGGELAAAGAPIIRELSQRVSKRFIYRERQPVQLRLSELSDSAHLLSSGNLAFENWALP